MKVVFQSFIQESREYYVRTIFAAALPGNRGQQELAHAAVGQLVENPYSLCASSAVPGVLTDMYFFSAIRRNCGHDSAK